MEHIFLLTVIIFIFVSGLMIYSRLKEKKRISLMQRPIPPWWIMALQESLPIYSVLPDALKQRLHGLINVFLEEKTFEGCGGLDLTDKIKLIIAAQACILILNKPELHYKLLKTILVYPTSFTNGGKSLFQSSDYGEEKQVRSGESWTNGTVILSWNSVKGGAANMHDGHNVAFHEFAHQLDQEDGVTDGAPRLDNRAAYSSWASVLGAEYRKLVEDVEKHRKNYIDSYGATAPCEFFAVTTETFFEEPLTMIKKSPELYQQLAGYYRLDPAKWMNDSR